MGKKTKQRWSHEKGEWVDTQESVATWTDAITDNGGTVAESLSKIEEEQAFVIISDDPKDVLQRLCNFEKLSGSYTVGVGELLHIVDTFYDTADELVMGSKSSLRVREIDGKPHVTIKGKNESKTGASKRSELEVAWPWMIPSPHNVAQLFGMESIQQRKTTRIARPILRKFDGKLIAELAIDKVSYGVASIYEVEIEMKSSIGASLYTLTQDLQKKFPELKKWKTSKFAIGNLLEQVLLIKTDDTGFITPESYEALSKIKVVKKDE